MKRRLWVWRVRRAAVRAIGAGLKPGSIGAVTSCERDPADPRTVIVRLSTTAALILAAQALRDEGYLVQIPGREYVLRVRTAVKART